MEVVAYVLDGALSHKDGMGNGSATIRSGDIQMSALRSAPVWPTAN